MLISRVSGHCVVSVAEVRLEVAPGEIYVFPELMAVLRQTL